MSPTACRFPKSWPCARSVWPSSRRRARRSRRGRKSDTSASGARHQAKLAAREAKTAATGKKPGGKPPAPPVEGPLPKDQINLTDEDSRIMPAAGGGFEQAYNAQAVVAAGSLLVVAADVVQAPNDKQQLEPMLGKIEVLPERLGAAETLLAGRRLFQRGECRGLPAGRSRTADRDGPSAASSPCLASGSGGRSPRRKIPRRSKPWPIG